MVNNFKALGNAEVLKVSPEAENVRIFQTFRLQQ
jgi:hypothetical protein